jgi:hypothetical protein
VLRDLLVHIPSERPIRPVIDAAVSLAITHAADLDAISIGFEYTNVDLAPDGGGAIAAVIEIEQQRALARANAALDIAISRNREDCRLNIRVISAHIQNALGARMRAYCPMHYFFQIKPDTDS